MNNKILSISVASYNVEKFIEQALNSYLECECREKIEVLIINDGSTDRTEEIVKGYEKQYPDIIRLINQENAGPGSTVNTGLKHATGKYFRMIDGDDWVKSDEMNSYIDFLEKNDTDMVVTNFIMVDDKTKKQILQDLKINLKYNEEYKFDEICKDLELDMHNVTYKTDLIKNRLKLDNGFYTDIEYLLFPIKDIKTVVFLKNYIYMYRVALDTQSVNINSLQKHCDMHEKVLSSLMIFYKDNINSFSSNKRKYLAKRIAKMIGTQMYIYLSYEASNEYKSKIKELLKSIQKSDKDIYSIISKKKTVKILRLTHYLAYRIISNKIRKEKIGG